MLCKLKLFCVGGSEDRYVPKDDYDEEQLNPYIDIEEDEK